MLYDVLVQGFSENRWFYDERLAKNALGFIHRYCHHYKGVMAPRRMTLELWERAGISSIFGIVDGTGKRQFNQVFWPVGRKQGKTLIAGGIGTYMGYAAGEYGSEVYYLAPKLEQADLAYSALEFNVHAEPELDAITKSTKYRGLVIQETNTIIRKLAFTSKKSDGYNPMFYCADEVAAWPGVAGLRQWEVMASGTGARQEPLGLAISSGGYENDGLYDELMKRGTGFLMGNSREQHLLPIIYMIDDAEKWDDLTELKKSLPNMGVSVSEEFIRKEIDTAHESISKEITDAEDKEKQATEKLEEATKKLDASHEEAMQIIADARTQAEKQSETIIETAKKEAQEIRDRAEEDAKRTRKAMMEEMKDEVADLAVTIAGRVLSSGANGVDEASLREKALSELESAEVKTGE